MKNIIFIALFSLCAFINLNASNLKLNGAWHYTVNLTAKTVSLSGETIENKEPEGKSGNIKLKLYLTREKYTGATITGYVLAESQFEQLPAKRQYLNVEKTENFLNEPPAGTYYATLVLLEHTADGYVIKDHYDFPETVSFTNSTKTANETALQQDYLTIKTEEERHLPPTRPILEACYECHGSGRCTVCSGNGMKHNFGKPQACEVCGGSGVCTRCKGSKFER